MKVRGLGAWYPRDRSHNEISLIPVRSAVIKTAISTGKGMEQRTPTCRWWGREPAQVCCGLFRDSSERSR